MGVCYSPEHLCGGENSLGYRKICYLGRQFYKAKVMKSIPLDIFLRKRMGYSMLLLWVNIEFEYK